MAPSKKADQKSYEPVMKSKVAKVMREFKRKKLRSSSGSKVRSKAQAIAIALSEARRAKK